MGWKWKDLFDDYFWNRFKEKFGRTIFRLIRIIVLLMVLSYFYNLSIVPSKSMVPTMQVKDFLVIKTKFNVYERYDIIAFKYPLDETQTYLKRIIGLPGETVEIKDGRVYINGNPLEEDYINAPPYYTYEVTTIPKGEYFVLGDNRNNSDDSHVWGFVKEEKIRGKVVMRILPFHRIKVFH